MTNQINRRDVLKCGLGAAALLADGRPAYAREGAVSPLKASAAGRGLLYGCEVEYDPMRKDPVFLELIRSQAGEIVAGFEMKWGQIEKERGQRDYRKGDYFTDWAMQNGLRMRGHTVIWHKNLPNWAPSELAGPGGAELMRDHIESFVGRYRGRIKQWDVVNEAIEPLDGRSDRLRKGPFLDAFGPGYIAEAFRIARATDTGAELFYNDYNFEYDTPLEDQRRETALRILTELKRENLVDSLGIQSHLKVGNRFNQRKFRRFLSDVADLGVRIVATEFDVNDTRLPADPEVRDAKIADHATLYLETLLDEPMVSGVLSWGLSNRYTYLNLPPLARSDGAPTRGLPFDEQFVPTGLYEVMKRTFETSPMRAEEAR